MSRQRDQGIQAAKKFQKFVEYDFSKMTDTKGGFLTAEDDPFNKALHTPNQEEKPANMTLKEWERAQLIKKLLYLACRCIPHRGTSTVSRNLRTAETWTVAI